MTQPSTPPWRQLRCYGCGERWSHTTETSVLLNIHGRDHVIGYTCSHCQTDWIGVPPNVDKTRLAQAFQMVFESQVAG